eukprot:gene11188-15008_t
MLLDLTLISLCLLNMVSVQAFRICQTSTFGSTCLSDVFGKRVMKNSKISFISHLPHFGKKIEDEEASLSTASSKKKGRSSKLSKSKTSNKNNDSPGSTTVEDKNETGAKAIEEANWNISFEDNIESNKSIYDPLNNGESIKSDLNLENVGNDIIPAVEMETLFATALGAPAVDQDPIPANENGDLSSSLPPATFSPNRRNQLRVPKGDPLAQTLVPPEVVFFGEPRTPPPPNAVYELNFHPTLLKWARHATFAPQTSSERLELVFPQGKYLSDAMLYRLPSQNLTYKMILEGFIKVMDNTEKSKAFINANIDIVPSALFLRALTAQKLAVQSRKDSRLMDFLKEVRRKYILANDQLFFPLNIEVQKAETRVMTYLARDEMRNFAQSWDEVEMSLHFTCLLSARITWDLAVKGILDDIKSRMDDAVEYMREGLKRDLMSRQFRRPALTSEVYQNASFAIQFKMPELYAKVRPEVKAMHETYFMADENVIKSYLQNDFCPRNNISMDQLKERLRIYEATVAAIADGGEYTYLRNRIHSFHDLLCSNEEKKNLDNWYFDHRDSVDGDFETYEENEIDDYPLFIKYQDQVKDKGNAFANFANDVLKVEIWSDHLKGGRIKSNEVGAWLNDDIEFTEPPAPTFEDKLEEFRKAYFQQTELRKEAEKSFKKMVINRLDEQEAFLTKVTFTREEKQELNNSNDIMEFDDNNNNNDEDFEWFNTNNF